jgi:hypothetical protein
MKIGITQFTYLSREQHEAILDYYGVRTIYDLNSEILEGYGI